MTSVAEIALRLPHRYPLLLVDRVVDLVPGQHITAVKAVTASEPWFRDSLSADPESAYFPPGLLIESLCQVAALLVLWEAPTPNVLDGEVPLLGMLSEVSFHALVEPGSVLQHQARLIRDLGNSFMFEGETTVEDHPVLRIGQMLMVIRPVRAVAPPAAACTADLPKAGCVCGV